MIQSKLRRLAGLRPTAKTKDLGSNPVKYLVVFRLGSERHAAVGKLRASDLEHSIFKVRKFQLKHKRIKL